MIKLGDIVYKEKQPTGNETKSWDISLPPKEKIIDKAIHGMHLIDDFNKAGKEKAISIMTALLAPYMEAPILEREGLGSMPIGNKIESFSIKASKIFEILKDYAKDPLLSKYQLEAIIADTLSYLKQNHFVDFGSETMDKFDGNAEVWLTEKGGDAAVAILGYDIAVEYFGSEILRKRD